MDTTFLVNLGLLGSGDSSLLEKTHLPIKNICWLAGFTNIEQMRMNFLQYLGMTPSRYRQASR